MASDQRTRTPGGVRALEDAPGCEPASNETPDVAALEYAIAAQCRSGAAAILTQLANQAGPPELFVSLVRSRSAQAGVIGLQVQANFDAYLYCRLRRADASVLAITPEPAALPMRVVASTPYDVLFPSLDGETRGAVQCMAVDAAGPAPDVGDWPSVFDAERLTHLAPVATAALNVHSP